MGSSSQHTREEWCVVLRGALPGLEVLAHDVEFGRWMARSDALWLARKSKGVLRIEKRTVTTTQPVVDDQATAEIGGSE